MNGLKKYGVPTMIVTLASLIICLGLWAVYVSGDNAGEIEVIIEGVEEADVLDLGILTPLITFLVSGIKVAALVGISGLITILVRRVIDRNLHNVMNI